MPVIRVSDETWRALKAWAEPLEDAPDDVVRRLLEIAQRSLGETLSDGERNEPHDYSEPRPLRRTRGITPQKNFREPVLDAIVELGGSAPARRVLELVEHHMRSVMTEADYEELRSGGPRWHKAANWARYILAQEGLVRRNSPRGTWELTDEGRRGPDE